MIVKAKSFDINANDMKNIAVTLSKLDEQKFASRLAEKDPTLWNQDDAGIKAISNRLGWVDIIDEMRGRVSDINDFVDALIRDGFKDAVLMGMGGSSLSPEVSRLTFGIKPRYLNLHVLDTTDPTTISNIEKSIDFEKTLFIAATKSGATIETISACKYFFNKIKKSNPGNNFIAITDPDTPLVIEAERNNFRRIFLNFPTIGGRYSALTYFGLIPAAIIGADISRILDSADSMSINPAAKSSEHEGIIIGAAIAELAGAGRDKLTFVASPEIASFGLWVEQLIAESTGKNGKGIVPVEGEDISIPYKFNDDRQFVYLRLKNGSNTATDSFAAKTAHPIITINLDDIYDIGREYLRWMSATAVMCSIMGVNAFDELDVTGSKNNTKKLIKIFNETGELPASKPIFSDNEISIYGKTLNNESLGLCLKSFLDIHKNGDYFAIMAFLPYSAETYEILQEIRSTISNRHHSASTLGYGPRFLHSTGQLHKGGPNKGVFIQFTADDSVDMMIPGTSYGFSILKQAQSDGDIMALDNKDRRYIRIHLGHDINGGLTKLLELIRSM